MHETETLHNPRLALRLRRTRHGWCERHRKYLLRADGGAAHGVYVRRGLVLLPVWGTIREELVKLQIIIPGKRIAVELEGNQAEERFAEFAGRLIRPISPAAKEVRNLPQNQTSVPDEGSPYQEPSADEDAPVVWENPDFEPPVIAPKGFLWVKCPVCGEQDGFSSKHELQSYHCKACGEYSSFVKPLSRLHVNCSVCRKVFRYFTNMDEPVFDIPCLGCETPVTVEFNEKKRLYETIPRD